MLHADNKTETSEPAPAHFNNSVNLLALWGNLQQQSPKLLKITGHVSWDDSNSKRIWGYQLVWAHTGGLWAAGKACWKFLKSLSHCSRCRRNNWDIMCFSDLLRGWTVLVSTVTTFLDKTESWNRSSQILVHLAQKHPVWGKPRRGRSHADSAITNRLFKPAFRWTCQNFPYYFLSPQNDLLRQHLFHMNTSYEDIFIFSHDPKRLFLAGAHKAHLFVSTDRTPALFIRFSKKRLDQTRTVNMANILVEHRLVCNKNSLV